MTYRQNRVNADGRPSRNDGVAIFMRTSVTHTHIPSIINTTIENVIVKLTDNLHILCIYARPNRQFTITDLYAITSPVN